MTIGIREGYDQEAEYHQDMYFVEINQHLIAMDYVSLKSIYLCSVLLIILGCDVSFGDFDIDQSALAENAELVYHTSAIEDL